MKFQLWWPHNSHRLVISGGKCMENEVGNRKEGLRFVSYGALEEADSQNSLLITQMPVLYSRHSFVDSPTGRLKLR